MAIKHHISMAIWTNSFGSQVSVVAIGGTLTAPGVLAKRKILCKAYIRYLT
jgi:hypothetical protein